MVKQLIILVLFTTNVLAQVPPKRNFVVEFNYVAFYDLTDLNAQWTDWMFSHNILIFNYNATNDVIHIVNNNKQLTYRSLNDIKIECINNICYQIGTFVDDKNDKFKIQVYFDRYYGIKFIYDYLIIQFGDGY